MEDLVNYLIQKYQDASADQIILDVKKFVVDLWKIGAITWAGDNPAINKTFVGKKSITMATYDDVVAIIKLKNNGKSGCYVNPALGRLTKSLINSLIFSSVPIIVVREGNRLLEAVSCYDNEICSIAFYISAEQSDSCIFNMLRDDQKLILAYDTSNSDKNDFLISHGFTYKGTLKKEFSTGDADLYCFD